MRKVSRILGISRRFKLLAAKQVFHFSLLIALIVWGVWLATLGLDRGLSYLSSHWEVAVTMIFGSMVAGATSMGGGAVAFPVFTKVLHISPHDAKIFSLAIQSIGMSAASLTIIAIGTKVEWRLILWASLGGIPGIVLGSILFAPLLPPVITKISFTMMVSSFAVVLFALNRNIRARNLAIPFWGQRERFLSIAVGLLGGITSGLVGSGMDIVCFSVMVLLFGLCEKVSTPTSVILMAVNAITGFILHKYFIGDFVEPVLNYWLAAVPVVVVGAPIGAMVCSLLQAHIIVRILICLICLELVSSFLLIPLNFGLICYSLLVFTIFLSIYFRMYKTRLYIQRDFYTEKY